VNLDIFILNNLQIFIFSRRRLYIQVHLGLHHSIIPMV
jgi:hypothetical protein